MAQLTKFITSLSTDSGLLDQFKKDPSKVMDGAGLSQADKDLILSKDSQKISDAVASEQAIAADAAFTIGITVSISILS